jgi:hypothetical protein
MISCAGHAGGHLGLGCACAQHASATTTIITDNTKDDDDGMAMGDGRWAMGDGRWAMGNESKHNNEQTNNQSAMRLEMSWEF